MAEPGDAHSFVFPHAFERRLNAFERFDTDTFVNVSLSDERSISNFR
jgi:hypothetical protein